ncbi:conserved hypothetical protein, partial [Ricinus communis]
RGHHRCASCFATTCTRCSVTPPPSARISPACASCRSASSCTMISCWRSTPTSVSSTC